jgi:hypothetical protein
MQVVEIERCRRSLIPTDDTTTPQIRDGSFFELASFCRRLKTIVTHSEPRKRTPMSEYNRIINVRLRLAMDSIKERFEAELVECCREVVREILKDVVDGQPLDEYAKALQPRRVPQRRASQPQAPQQAKRPYHKGRMAEGLETMRKNKVAIVFEDGKYRATLPGGKQHTSVDQRYLVYTVAPRLAAKSET